MTTTMAAKNLWKSGVVCTILAVTVVCKLKLNNTDEVLIKLLVCKKTLELGYINP